MSISNTVCKFKTVLMFLKVVLCNLPNMQQVKTTFRHTHVTK
jgi:hypothetical protein